MKYIYMAACKPGLIKIGISNNPKQRMVSLWSDMPGYAIRGTMKLVGAFEGTLEDERDLHRSLSPRFLAGDRREWYVDCPELRAEVEGMFVIPPKFFEPIPYSESQNFKDFLVLSESYNKACDMCVWLTRDLWERQPVTSVVRALKEATA